MLPVDPVLLLAFIPAALLLNLTPGADMMFCLGQGLRGGARAALAADLGISVGAMVHVLAAGLGLGALVAAQPWLFEAIRWLGVGYLLWLAWGALRGGGAAAEAPGRALRPARAFRDALLVNLTNPKVILFVLAFIPQFIRPEAGPVLVQFLVFGAILSLGGLVVNGAVGVFAAGLGQGMARASGFRRGLELASGAIFAGLAVRLALGGRN